MAYKFILAISLGLLGLSWLVPNHYFPWVSAWGDGLAVAGILLLVFLVVAGEFLASSVSRNFIWFVGLLVIGVLLQVVSGKLLFTGDAWMVVLYAGLWLLALIVGRSLAEGSSGDLGGLDQLSSVWVLGAVLSVGVAMVQWTGALSLGIFAADLPPGSRPFGNVAQPNHLCTLCFLGICGLLWLYQQGLVRGAVLATGLLLLLFGMVMSGSRTGWLQVALLVVWGMAMKTRAGLKLGRKQFLVIGMVFATGVLLWPTLNELLLLAPGRNLADQMQPGTRWPFWLSMLDAIAREPWSGYGWQQIAIAQQNIALDHPSVGAHFEHSHNIVLDLILWCGLPLGGLMVILLGSWFFHHIRNCWNQHVFYMLLAIFGVMAHGMLEFPLEYAYFLIPLGLAMGAVDGLSHVKAKAVALGRPVVLMLATALSVLFGLVVVDYLNAEQNYRDMRLEARLGSRGLATPAPDLRVLTQLQAFLEFARAEATQGMADDRLNWMRDVARRFGYPPVMFRFALAAGLNGRPDEARLTLARLCRIHGAARCAEAQEGWRLLQQKFPQLQQVAVPAM